jgi:gliding motility-associated-like protein
VNLVSLHDLKCNNDNTGSINIAALDSGTIGYLWSTQASTQNVANLAAGTYQVTATDQFGCTGTATYTLSQPAPLVLGTPTFVNPLCHGGNNGTATDIASGGSGSYYYAWNTVPQQNTQQATGLSAATYIVTVTDDSSCTATASVTLTDPPSMTFAVPIVTNTHCFGSNDGTAQIVPQGGAGGYRYLWSDRAQQTTNPAVGLSEGTYTVTVTDANGCTATTTATVGQPPATSVSATPTDLTCFQNNSGSAIAAASGGTPPYLYVWNNGDSAAQINNLQATTYTVTSTDANNCTATASTTLNQPTQITVSGSAVSTNCPTSTDGSITATATGGTGTYTYAIEDVTGNIIQSNSSGTFTGLGPNVFTIVATDQNGCNATTVITVPSPPFNVYSASADSTSCYGAQYTDGRIHLQGFTIANGPFQFSVDSGQLQYTPDFYNLAAGAHTVKIVDAHGCDTVFTVIVGAPLPASVDILPGDSTIVLGSNLQLSTVFGPYDQDSIKAYAWSPGEGLSCIDCPGPVVSPYGSQNVYTVTVTYNQGCIATAVVRINVAGDPPVYIPNAFTPNGDGTNDVLYVYGEGIKTVKMMIFDRWGEKVFESDNQSVGWDGTFRGQQESPGVYVYIADMIYLNDHTKHKEGSITLIR